jgi:hypothetical protein
MNKPELPISLALVEAEKEIYNAINSVVEKYRLPFFLLEPTVTKAAREVSEYAAAERQRAKAEYEKQLEEYEKGGADNG